MVHIAGASQSYGGDQPGELVEDMQQADLVSFLEGFVQGARATLHIDLEHPDKRIEFQRT